MLNIEKLKSEFLMSDNDLLNFITISNESLKVDLKNFENALTINNENLIKKTAHKLKSGFNYLNLIEVAKIFDKIQNFENISINIENVVILYNSCKIDIDNLLNQLDTLILKK